MPSKDPKAPDQDAIWDYFQNEAPESFEGSGARIEFLVSRVGRAGAKVLNIGVGSGIFEREAINRSLDVYSLDPSPVSIEKLRKELGLGQKAQAGYGQDMPFESGYFDTVVISEVFEHLTKEITGQTLAEINRVLKKGGKIIGTVPAREDLSAQIVVCPDCSKRFHRWGHQQRFEVKNVVSMLSQHFTLLDAHERPFIYFKGMNWKGKAVGLIKFVLWKLGIHGSDENIYFEASKA